MTGGRPRPAVPREALRWALNRMVRDSLPPVLVGLAALYVFFFAGRSAAVVAVAEVSPMR